MSKNTLKISFWNRLINLISPRACTICGNRLGLHEDILCGKCNLHLPRTHHVRQPYDNEMAKLFWGRLPIERAAALTHYASGSQVSNIIYQLKYGHRPETGIVMGELIAKEFIPFHFFDDIDLIIPVPLAKPRQRQRGYNQSEMIAEGVSHVTRIKMDKGIIIRTIHTDTQTHKDRWERADNVKDAFDVVHPDKLRNKHILLIDDVATTGSTLCACGRRLVEEEGVRISILTLGVAL